MWRRCGALGRALGLWHLPGRAPVSAALCTRPKDYALPNGSWSADMLALYRHFQAMTETGPWKRIPSYSNVLDHSPDSTRVARERRGGTRLFLRSIDAEGAGFEYAMFVNADERRVVCLFQPGPYLEGPPGFAHGGSIATIIDSTVGGCALAVAGPVMTAKLSIDYMAPVPLGAVVLVDSRVERLQGRKVFLRGQMRSADGGTVHAEATALFIQLEASKSRELWAGCP